MRHLCTVLAILFAAALPCHAQGDKAKPNTLTPKEIADGWILLFDGETTFGWKIDGDSSVKDGQLWIGNTTKHSSAELTTAFDLFEVRFGYGSMLAPPAAPGAPDPSTPPECGAQQGEKVSPPHKIIPPSEWLMFRVLPHSKKFGPLLQGRGQIVARVEITPRLTRQFLVKLRPDMSQIASGADLLKNHLRFDVPKGAALILTDIKLKPNLGESIFNGTDLAGWKEFPGKKSKFAVIDGAINVKDGPGDLQTVGKYKDFILQLECKSNGKHLNSGIFFRCRDNEYQNGYEAQIRNQFTEKPDQKYSIEEYDPKTNKLIGKKEQFFTAVDFGTGAIYRRQPARKQMSKDGEWFTMTIVAHGNHLATWVNGVQVTDWYDNRPKSDNARTGCKLDAGHISIQGHDPTTDLSFRNIRIAEFK